MVRSIERPHLLAQSRAPDDVERESTEPRQDIDHAALARLELLRPERPQPPRLLEHGRQQRIDRARRERGAGDAALAGVVVTLAEEQAVFE